jgi:hypothetical protein
MSLINDALRQASQAHKQQMEPPPAPAAPAPPPLPPHVLQAAPLSPWPSLIKLVLVILLGTTLFACAGFFLHRAWGSHRSQIAAALDPHKPGASANLTLPNHPSPKTTPQSLLQSVRMETAKSPSSPAALPNTATAREIKATPSAPLPVTGSPDPKAAVVPPPAVKWPSLRLQGIFYRPPESAVVINNKTLYMGDEFQGVKVAQIDRDRVTLSMSGQTNSLFLR